MTTEQKEAIYEMRLHLDKLNREISELRTELATKEAAIEWALSEEGVYTTVYEFKRQLRTRAYPEPEVETEEVPITMWVQLHNGSAIDSTENKVDATRWNNNPAFGYEVLECTSKRIIPKPRKLKRREVIHINNPIVNVITYNPSGAPAHAKFFAEWEE